MDTDQASAADTALDNLMADISARLDALEAAKNSGDMNAGAVAEFHTRTSAVETAVADIRAQLDAARSSGAIQPYEDFMAHVVHVMQKHFHHDRPDPVSV